MPYTMVVDQFNLGDQEIYIHGLGAFSNGTYDISDEQANAFRVANSTEVGEHDLNPDSPTYGSYQFKVELGPTLLDAAKSMHGITVTEVKPAGKTSSKPATDSKVPVESPATKGPEVNS